MFAQTNTIRLPQWLTRALRTGLTLGLFVTLIAISARIRIGLPGTPVPVTLQTLAILLTGMILGPVQGALAVLTYLGLIASGLPLDTWALGPAALVSPTAGFLLGFVPAAFLAGAGWRGAGSRFWRQVMVGFGAGCFAVGLIYVFGAFGLLPFTGGSWATAVLAGVVPFVFVDFGKVLLAVGLVQLGRESWLRWFSNHS